MSAVYQKHDTADLEFREEMAQQATPNVLGSPEISNSEYERIENDLPVKKKITENGDIAISPEGSLVVTHDIQNCSVTLYDVQQNPGSEPYLAEKGIPWYPFDSRHKLFDMAISDEGDLALAEIGELRTDLSGTTPSMFVTVLGWQVVSDRY